MCREYQFSPACKHGRLPHNAQHTAGRVLVSSGLVVKTEIGPAVEFKPQQDTGHVLEFLEEKRKAVRFEKKHWTF